MAYRRGWPGASEGLRREYVFLTLNNSLERVTAGGRRGNEVRAEGKEDSMEGRRKWRPRRRGKYEVTAGRIRLQVRKRELWHWEKVTWVKRASAGNGVILQRFTKKDGFGRNEGGERERRSETVPYF